MRYRALALPVLGIIVLAVSSGCSEKNPQNRRAVSGAVTLDGAAIEQGSIRFDAAEAGGIGSGALVSDGQYSIPTAKGLPPGRYKVMLFASKPGWAEKAAAALPGDPVPPTGEMIPAEYNVKSDKYVEVAEDGTAEFDFHVVSKP